MRKQLSPNKAILILIVVAIQGSHNLFGNGAGAFRIGKNSVVSTKIGKKIQCFMKFLLSD